MRVIILLALSLGACATAEAQRPPQTPRDPLAAIQPLVDCRWKAANRLDDGKRSVKDLADQIFGICLGESIKARRAFHLPLNDPQLDMDEYRQVLEVIDDVRKTNARR
jgi:hypothetical protein